MSVSASTIVPWSSSRLQNPIINGGESQEQVQSVIDIHEAELYVAVVEPVNRCWTMNPTNSWIYQFGLILISLTSMADIYVVCTQYDDLYCYSNNTKLVYNMFISAACILCVSILYYGSYITRYEDIVNKSWLNVAKYMMRTFLTIWIILAGMYTIGLSEDQCNSEVYLYLQASYILKIGLMVLEYIWALSSCPM
jgi:hypothetical protein